MRTKIGVVLALALLPFRSLPSTQPAQNAQSPVDFYSQVEPIFRGHCYGCHDETNSESNLRLDNKVSAFKGGDSGPVIRPGDSQNSVLIHRVLGLNGLRR